MKRRTTSRKGSTDRPSGDGPAGGRPLNAGAQSEVAVADLSPTEPVCDDWTRPHRTAFAVQSRLRREPGLDFESLVVREFPNGVCLEGVVSVGDIEHDIDALVRLAAGVDRVINRLVVRGDRDLDRNESRDA